MVPEPYLFLTAILILPLSCLSHSQARPCLIRRSVAYDLNQARLQHKFTRLLTFSFGLSKSQLCITSRGHLNLASLHLPPLWLDTC